MLEIDSSSAQRLARIHALVKNKDTSLYGDTFLVDRSTNWCFDVDDALETLSLITLNDLFDSLFGPEYAWIAAGLTLAGACHGGLHLAAWASAFLSHAETILWRSSSITILTTGPAAIVLVLCKCLVHVPVDALTTWFMTKEMWSVNVAIDGVASLVKGSVFGAVMLWYIICRAFIVVECFIMLAHIPDTALGVPSWTQYIPHIA